MVRQNDDNVPIGNVISVSPDAGTNAAPGTEITLTISTGPQQSQENEKVNVPSYIGLTQEDATSSLEKKGLKVEIAYSTSGAYNKGDVIKQNPVGGSEVPKGSTVVLTINDPDKAASGEDNQTAGTGAKWVCRKELQEPSNYNGGSVEIVLIQQVNGETVTTSVYSGTNPWANGPYTPTIEGASGVSTGTIQMTENGGGTWKWDAPFSES